MQTLLAVHVWENVLASSVSGVAVTAQLYLKGCLPTVNCLKVGKHSCQDVPAAVLGSYMTHPLTS